MMSSYSLAFVPCDNDFRLFHEEIRCRQPHYAILLSVTSGLSAAVLFVFGYKAIKHARDT